MREWTRVPRGSLVHAMPLSGWMMVAVAMVFAPMAARAESQALPQDEGAAQVSEEAPRDARAIGPAARRHASRGPRVAEREPAPSRARVLGGAVGGTFLGATGILVISGTCGVNMLCSFLGGLGGLFAATAGLVAGSLPVGHWMDGAGAWWSMLAGVAVGVALGVVASAFIRSEYAGWGVLVSAVGAPLFGGLAYELTSHDSAKRFNATRPRGEVVGQRGSPASGPARRRPSGRGGQRLGLGPSAPPPERQGDGRDEHQHHQRADHCARSDRCGEAKRGAEARSVGTRSDPELRAQVLDVALEQRLVVAPVGGLLVEPADERAPGAHRGRQQPPGHAREVEHPGRVEVAAARADLPRGDLELAREVGAIAGEDVVQIVEAHRALASLGVGEREGEGAELEVDPIGRVPAVLSEAALVEVASQRRGHGLHRMDSLAAGAAAPRVRKESDAETSVLHVASEERHQARRCARGPVLMLRPAGVPGPQAGRRVCDRVNGGTEREFPTRNSKAGHGDVPHDRPCSSACRRGPTAGARA
ncbi:hypothetical protein MXAN_0507 [Myxococcus xanthus DK 1622]|uniref:Uncharacterized protein n=1 Tax=Myxococcus xanthus (strain DK1622) TaxID=246197 RepID=Q1DEZ7_MYXXD|nr:hypothetical protein MXAN_0507 [Myxococcus xanthus DK 1622]